MTQNRAHDSAAKLLPAIYFDRVGKRTEAVVALELSAIIPADLARGNDEESKNGAPFDPQLQMVAQRALLQAIAGWPANIVAELHWTAWPDLKYPSNGQMWVTVFARAVAKDRESAAADVLACYFRLKPLLQVHFRHLSFAPVQTLDRLRQRLVPFDARQAVEIVRKHERIELNQPIKSTSLGFGPLRQEAMSAEAVDLCFAWVSRLAPTDGLARLLMQQMDPIQLIVRVAPCQEVQSELSRLRAVVQACDRFLTEQHSRDLTLKQHAGLLKAVVLKQMLLLSDASLKVGAVWVSPGALDVETASMWTHMILANTSALNDEYIHMGGFATQRVAADLARRGRHLPLHPLSTMEAAAMFQLPTAPMAEVLGLPVQRWRTAMAALGAQGASEKEGIVLFDNVHQGTMQPIVMSNEDRLRHMAIFGGTGTGKSTFMAQMILSDIAQGGGVSVIDPHGSLVESILGCIPRQRWEDVILFDVTDREMPMAFNLLRWETIEERDLIIDELFACMDIMYNFKENGGPIFENNFRNILALLCGDSQSRAMRGGYIGTVVDVLRCYQDSDYRTFLKKTISNNEVQDFVRELERTGGDACLSNLSPYITSKFGRFNTDTTLKRIFGQTHVAFDFEEIIEKKKILLVNLGRGHFGESVCSLLCTMLLSKLKLAAMKRGALTDCRGREHFIYVDEAGLVPGHVLAGLLSEARKYGVGVTIGSQYTKQLTGAVGPSRRDTLLDSVHGNVGAMVVFRLGKEDAKEMSGLFWPTCSMLDIVRLPNYRGYAKMSLGSQGVPPFSFQTRPLAKPFEHSRAEQIRAHSRFLYGTPVAEVDVQIAKRRTAWKAR